MATSGTSPATSYIRRGVGLMCLGAVIWGIAPIVGYPGWAIPGLLVHVVAGITTITLGNLKSRRLELLRHLELTLAPLLGAGAGRAGLVEGTRWTRSQTPASGVRRLLSTGSPRRLRIRYSTGKVKAGEAGAVEIGDDRWAREVIRQVGTRLEGTYRLTANKRRRGRLELMLVLPAENPEPESPQLVRAKGVINDLLGGTATVKNVDLDPASGEPVRLEVAHEVGAKLVASGYRRRVEAAVTTLLPGRWRAKWDMEGDSVLFEVRPTLPDSIWIPPRERPNDDPLRNYREVRIPYGVDEDGNVMSWRPAVNPMWLLTGTTGSGKRRERATAASPGAELRRTRVGSRSLPRILRHRPHPCHAAEDQPRQR